MCARHVKPRQQEKNEANVQGGGVSIRPGQGGMHAVRTLSASTGLFLEEMFLQSHWEKAQISFRADARPVPCVPHSQRSHKGHRATPSQHTHNRATSLATPPSTHSHHAQVPRHLCNDRLHIGAGAGGGHSGDHGQGGIQVRLLLGMVAQGAMQQPTGSQQLGHVLMHGTVQLLLDVQRSLVGIKVNNRGSRWAR